MKRLVFHFDVISPFACLAFERLPQVLEGVSHVVEYRPVLFGALLSHWGQLGPAEIEPKRAWTFRHVGWLAAQHGIRLETPAQHPFNPLPMLRLLLASAPDFQPNRRAVEAAFAHVWHGGLDPLDPARLEALRTTLAPVHDPAGDAVKAALRANTDAAIAAGIFGVPTVEWEGRHFWGLDGLPMLRDALQGGAWFQGSGWDEQGLPRAGLVRKR
jgi:2-hydroxychromene-2-carboxylate isomerase